VSATNAISGISLVGSLVAAGANYGPVSRWLGRHRGMPSTINVVGGFHDHRPHCSNVQA